EQAPDQPAYVELAFERGVLTRINGQQLDGVAAIQFLNELGSEHGIGRIDIVENRLVGMKSRGCYETPGGTILLAGLKGL
ncbi:TPA: argininosuccinate synthase, partial [Candidatus Azambacteria bacterium]|nr:argininosuccinate synthase [Candidatus Azambacteria bacterium]